MVAKALHGLVSQIPTSAEKPADMPAVRADELAKSAAMKAAAISGTFTLPPGPLGLMTVLPDLLAVWRVQQQLVADIAAAFGRTESLTRETMILCLFKHGGAAVTQRLLSRGESNDVVVHRIANRTLQQLLEKIAVRVAQRLATKSVSRWIPILGAVGAGAYAYYDTTQVAKNATELFSKPLHLEAAKDELPGDDDTAATEANAELQPSDANEESAASESAPTRRRVSPRRKAPRKTTKASAKPRTRSGTK